MNEITLAFIILIAAYVFLAPMLIVIFNPVTNGFKEEYKYAFMGFHLIMFSIAGVFGVMYGITWAINVLLGAA